ncbi:phospholipase-like protein [Tanacetum coccineum]|uniref:Phospholipase-like protein n=1 Tax=Tanacetum coccineum TaxID=301880 RepID=A0ABQ5HP20_9ASTR
MSDFYDVKISVRSSIKLLPEIKGLLSVKLNRKSELVFMGKEKRNFLTKHIMWLVDDFDAWNAFPWGEYMWFAWAFMIWILESYPNSKKWRSKKANMIPRGLAWSKVKFFEKSDYDCLFRPFSNLNVALISSPEEMRQAWFMACVDFIKGLADQDGKFLQDDEARVNCIEHNNGMRGDKEVGKFFQDEEERVNGIEHHNVMCGDTEDSNFVEGIDETICPKTNQMSVEEGDGVLDSEGDGPSSSSSQLGNDKDASHLDDLMEIDGENVKDGYTNSQHHLHLLIKALESKIENHTLDVVVPPKDDDCILCTIKPNGAYDVVEVDNYEDDYMLITIVNAPKEKTTVLEETIGVKVEEKPRLGRGLGPLKVKKKKNCQQALRPNYVLRSTQDRKKKLAMALKPPFGQQSTTTPVPKKRKSKIMKTEVIVPPFDFEGKRDIVIGRSFWTSLSYCNTGNAGWLNDHHLDLWIDLMWSFRPPEADWAIVSPRFSTCILSGMMPDYYSNGHMYPLPWLAVEKVYFLVNEPKTHWCLAELEICTGVVSFYDSLVMHGIFESKGISADDYKITYMYTDAPFQASLFGDYRIWVCIFIYRLCCNLPLTVDDPLETALAYRERMLEYFWTHKIPVERTSSAV